MLQWLREVFLPLLHLLQRLGIELGIPAAHQGHYKELLVRITVKGLESMSCEERLWTLGPSNLEKRAKRPRDPSASTILKDFYCSPAWVCA